MTERRVQGDRRAQPIRREAGRRLDDALVVSPTAAAVVPTAVLVADLRRLAAAAQHQQRVRTSNLALLAAARLEELEAKRLLRRANDARGGLNRAASLTPERRREIAVQAAQHPRRRKFAS